MWYFLFIYQNVELFRQCGIFCFSIRFWNYLDSVIFFVYLLDFRTISTVWYFLFFYQILELFRQCGIFCLSIRFWNYFDSVVFFVYLLDFRTISTVWCFLFIYQILELSRQCGIFFFYQIVELFRQCGICCFSIYTIILCGPCYMPKYVPMLEGIMHNQKGSALCLLTLRHILAYNMANTILLLLLF